MTNFIQTGRYTQGCIVPVTTEDDSLTVMLDENSEDFRINFFIGKNYIDSIKFIDNKASTKNIHKDVLRLVVVNDQNENIGQVYKLIEQQMFYDSYRTRS